MSSGNQQLWRNCQSIRLVKCAHVWICIQHRIINSHLSKQTLSLTLQRNLVKSVSRLFTKYTGERKHPTLLVGISGNPVFPKEAVSALPCFMKKNITRPRKVYAAVSLLKSPLVLDFLKFLKSKSELLPSDQRSKYLNIKCFYLWQPIKVPLHQHVNRHKKNFPVLTLRRKKVIAVIMCVAKKTMTTSNTLVWFVL